jgi:signal transduction histidine kinase
MLARKSWQLRRSYWHTATVVDERSYPKLRVAAGSPRSTKQIGISRAGARHPSAEKASTEQDHADALVAVRDCGPGIDPAHLEQIFDAFYTTKSMGTGMGLSICRSIIDAHGGKLWAEANEPRGAAFQFILPGAAASS